MPPPRPLLLLTRSLERGGAERQLLALARGLDRSRFDVTLATLYGGGRLRDRAAAIPDLRLASLGKRSRWDLWRPAWRLWRLAAALRPAVIYGFMSPSNEMALGVGRAVGARVVWGIRASALDHRRYDWLTRVFAASGARLSRWPDAIVANAAAGRDALRAGGYRSDRIEVVPNGIDVAAFRCDRLAGAAARAEWGLAPGDRLIGLIGRLDPMKDHDTFLAAAAQLSAVRRDVRFLCMGDGPAGVRAALEARAQQLGIAGSVIWRDARDELVPVYSALDLLANASAFGEGFSNVVGEAMACGVPCVVTDVGDSAVIVGDTGVVVPPRRPEAMARAWAALLDEPPERRAERAAQARARVCDRFTVDLMVTRTEDVLARLLT